MKQRYRKLGVMMAVVLSLHTPIYGKEKEAVTTTYTLSQAIEEGLKNTSALKVKDWEIEKARDQSANVSAQAQGAQMMLTYTSVVVYEKEMELRRQADYYSREASIRVEMARKEKKLEEIKIKKDIKDAYGNVVQGWERLQSQQGKVDLGKNQLKAMELKEELGMVTATSVTEAWMSLMKEEVALQEARMQYETAFMELNGLTGRPLYEMDRMLQKMDVSLAVEIPNVEEMMEQAKIRRGDLYSAKALYDSKQSEYGSAKELGERKYGIHEYRDELNKIENEQIELEYRYETLERQIKIGLEKAYTGIEMAKRQVEMMQQNLEDTEKRYEQMKIRHELGQLSDLQLEEGTLMLQSARIQYQSALHSYNSALDQYFYLAGVEGVEILAGK
ncbi:MAG: TolC family protein [Epulopiscium sp.]|nr:TolC family protein [Candidatus Epulonipiscium sp.]